MRSARVEKIGRLCSVTTATAKVTRPSFAHLHKEQRACPELQVAPTVPARDTAVPCAPARAVESIQRHRPKARPTSMGRMLEEAKAKDGARAKDGAKARVRATYQKSPTPTGQHGRQRQLRYGLEPSQPCNLRHRLSPSHGWPTMRLQLIHGRSGRLPLEDGQEWRRLLQERCHRWHPKPR